MIEHEKEEYLMKFGENLKKLRKSKKLSQEDLAEKMKVSRQSVSKWETGDAYPEMNNILQLCKIFHCRINDLVNDSIIDVDSLDEEIKMNVVKFKKEQQQKMKGLSKAISIIARIGKVVCLVCIPILIVSMIFVGITIKDVDIVDNEIKIADNSIVSLIDEDDKLTLKLKGMVLIDATDSSEIATIKEVLMNNSKLSVFIFMESAFLVLIITLYLGSILLKSLEKLFNNIHNGDTPFTLENVGYIKKMAYLMIVLVILPSFGGGVFEILLKMDLDVDFEIFSLVEILFLFSIAYIFQYGYEIQLDSKGKMYGEENE